jgi:hypothetical protein
VKVIALMRKVEKWQIALGGDFERIKKGLAEAHTAWGTCADRLIHALSPWVPQPQTLPSAAAEVIAKLDKLELDLTNRAMDVQMVIWGLGIASQNRLLGGLFTYRVPVRKPGDPSVKVFTVAQDHTP